MDENRPVNSRARILYLILPICTALLTVTMGWIHISSTRAATASDQAFTQASQQTGVPVELLKSLCLLEGNLSMHGGRANAGGGYGCMNLVHIDSTDGCKALQENAGAACSHHFVRHVNNTLDKAAQMLHVSNTQVENDLTTNILAGASLLREDALASSATHTLPTNLPDWYGAVAAYSNADAPSINSMYADAVFKIIKTGFTAQTDQGATISLPAQAVTPNRNTLQKTAPTPLPTGCTNGGADYPQAINCILDAPTYDCNATATDQACNYESANRPSELAITHIFVHDVEGSALSALATFQNANNAVSAHYVVDTDGTVYEVLHNKDIGYHAGNYWYNQHSIGIEHAGFDQDGYKWYNATQYLASAKLAAFLLKQYHIPLDHDHIVSHGTIPSPFTSIAPNHVDPGPYWLWPYYENLIFAQNIAYPSSDSPASKEPSQGVITLQPPAGLHPFGRGGSETQDNFNFFYLYTAPSTASGLIPHPDSDTDVTEETDNVEPSISYYYTAKQLDQAGTGKVMYQIWYGEQDQVNAAYPANQFANAKQAWLAVPADAARQQHATGKPVVLQGNGTDAVPVYGRPATQAAGYATYLIGGAPSGAIFISGYTTTIAESDGTQTLWYELNYNHRQAWVPANTIKTL